MYKLPGKSQPSLQRVPFKNQHDIHNTRADGARTATEDNQLSSGDSNQNNPSTMEEGNTADISTMDSTTTDSGTMKDNTSTTTATMESDTTGIETSMPPTINLPTTSPTKQRGS